MSRIKSADDVDKAFDQALERLQKANREDREPAAETLRKSRRKPKMSSDQVKLKATEAVQAGKLSLEESGLVEAFANGSVSRERLEKSAPGVLGKLGIDERTEIEPLRKAAAPEPASPTAGPKPTPGARDQRQSAERAEGPLGTKQAHSGKVEYDPQAGGYRFLSKAYGTEIVASPEDVVQGLSERFRAGDLGNDVTEVERLSEKARRRQPLDRRLLNDAIT
jgi:hypothetical protein